MQIIIAVVSDFSYLDRQNIVHRIILLCCRCSGVYARALFLAILISIHAESDPSVTSPGFDGFSNIYKKKNNNNKKRNNRETSARDSHYYNIIIMRCSRFWRATDVYAHAADVPPTRLYT